MQPMIMNSLLELCLGLTTKYSPVRKMSRIPLANKNSVIPTQENPETQRDFTY